MNYAVVDLGFGDAGKGATVDHLCRTRDVGLVVRFNGGGQAGHNVVTEDGRHHTFSQWGSGTLAGVPTFLSRFMVVDPLALVPEAEHLRSIGVEDPWSMLTIDPRAIVLTPWHRAAQRFEEKLRGDKRHGTCGTGFGKAVEESIKHPERTLRWGNLRDGRSVVRRGDCFEVIGLEQFCRLRFGDHSLASMENSDGEHPWARQPDEVAKRFYAVAKRVKVKDWAPFVGEDPGVVFEGAQGVLLDENYGFHPHTTWSTTTFANADTLAREAGLDRPYRLGVTRSHSVRHGPGPFPTEDVDWVPGPEPHNGHDDWRGGVRYGPLDLVLLRYAVGACGGVDGVALTHLDAPRLNPVRTLDTPLGEVGAVPVDHHPSLARQEALGATLAHSSSAQRVDGTGDLLASWVSSYAHAPVVIESRGPTAADRREAARMPA